MPLGKKITTVLEPSTELKDELTLSTDKHFNYSAYLLKINQIRGTESGSIIVDLPRKSNIHRLEGVLDKYHKKIKNGEVLESINNNVHRKFYTDTFGSFTASKIERESGITFNLRGDVASQLTLQGNLFIQCNQSLCTVYIPRKMSVDYTKFSTSKIIGK